jgi:3-phenylpropionate/trans-cinnamate dioxygenase ferredoxin reductase subunit
MALVIVGAGQAAHQLAVSAREFGYAGPITMIGDEPHLPYQRPPLSKTFLTDTVESERLALAAPDFYAQTCISAQIGRKVTGIDRQRRLVRMDDGEAVAYVALVLATGSRNRLLPESDGVAGIHSVRSIADAGRLRDALATARRAVVVGAGLLGLEFACVARERGCDVTVVEAGSRIMQRALTPASAAFVQARHEESGLRLKLGCSIRRLVANDGRLTGIVCSDGETVPADLAVVAIGVLPNDELAAASGLAVDNGIVVDEQCRTADEAIFAIGDCARVTIPLLGRSFRLESVQNAIDHAKCLGRFLADNEARPYTALPSFWSKQGVLTIHVVGHTAGCNGTVELKTLATGTGTLCFTDGVLIGAECINSFKLFRNVRRFLEAGGRADAAQCRDLESWEAALAAFSP